MNNYFVGTTLDTIGNNRTREYGMDAQQAIAMAEARQRQAAILHQAMLERERMAQQQNQFNQELAFRQAGQGQANQYQNALLALKQQEAQNQINGFTPRDIADQNYRYAALENALKLEQERAKIPPWQIQSEKEKQAAIAARDLLQAQEAWDYNEALAKAQADQHNALLDQFEQEAKDKEKRITFGLDNPESRKLVADKYRRDKLAEILKSLPGNITLNKVTKRFEVMLPPRPGGARVNTNVDNPGMANNPVGFNVGLANKPIKVRTSDGRLWDTTAAMFAQFKRRDPGVHIVGDNAVPGNVSHGASDSWEEPGDSHLARPGAAEALLRALQ